jgi:hypothetical protein
MDVFKLKIKAEKHGCSELSVRIRKQKRKGASHLFYEAMLADPFRLTVKLLGVVRHRRHRDLGTTLELFFLEKILSLDALHMMN